MSTGKKHKSYEPISPVPQDYERAYAGTRSICQSRGWRCLSHLFTPSLYLHTMLSHPISDLEIIPDPLERPPTI